MVPPEDLVLMPETDARRALAGARLRLRVLAPFGAFAGRGILRVLRPAVLGEEIELICGYESYEPL
ncbi:MAG: hypothetical protein ABR508_02545 [Candidatus Baltobacteraceae bacterium]